MGQGLAAGLPTPGYDAWRAQFGGTKEEYRAWLRENGYAHAQQFADSLRAGGSLGNNGGPNLGNIPIPPSTGIPGPGQPTVGGPPQPTPIAPPPSIPSPAGAPAYAPPQVQMPQLLANPTPQGLGGMPLIRDRMMGTTMSPFAGPNWGVPQVNPAYLTQTVRLPQGATPADVMLANNAVPVGIAPPTQIPNAQAPPVGLGGVKIPRQPMYGLGTV